MSKIRGQVEASRVISQGWGTLTVLYGSDNERATVTGHPLGIEVGDTVEVTGDWTKHRKFGLQFKATTIRVVAPSNAAGAIAWILSRLPGVGRKRATAMVETWGLPELWAVMEKHPGELAAISGITDARALEIGRVYLEVAHERERIVALRGYGLSDRQASTVVEKWGADAVEKLRADPYVLAEIYGFGFKRSDAIAMQMGLPANHPSRIRAGLESMLEEARGKGHCYVPAAKLIAMTSRALGVTEREVIREGRAYIAGGKAVQREGINRKGENVARVYSAKTDAAEGDVARAVARLIEGGSRRV